MGKTFHDDAYFSPPDYDWPYSWTTTGECGSREYYTVPRDTCGANQSQLLCSKPDSNISEYEDAQYVNHAKALMTNFSNASAPFFLMVRVRVRP